MATPWMVPPFFCASCCAAVSAFNVAFFRCPWDCSATTRIVAISDHLRFFVELLHQRRHVRNLHTRRARGRRLHPHHFHFGRGVDSERLRLQLLDGLLLRLHD